MGAKLEQKGCWVGRVVLTQVRGRVTQVHAKGASHATVHVGGEKVLDSLTQTHSTQSGLVQPAAGISDRARAGAGSGGCVNGPRAGSCGHAPPTP